MMQEKSRSIDWVKNLTLVVAFFTVIFQIYQPEDQEEKLSSLLWFVAILIYAGIAYAIIYYSGRVKGLVVKINRHEEDIEQIKGKMRETERFAEIEKKIAVLEAINKKNKKGQIDPKIVLFIILLILLYFYLRSIGVSP